MTLKIALLFLCTVSLTALGDEVFKWTDENGKIQYGGSVPERYKQNARRVDLTGVETSDTQREEAKARAAREKAKAELLQRAREAQPDLPQAAAPQPPGVPKPADACEEQMKKYLESQDCFAPYRNANGGINPEAFQRCTEVKQPKGCFPAPGSVERTYMGPAP